MTNQEVAKSLKNIRDLYPWGEDSYKTLDYAIRAVVELPKRRKEAKRWRAKAHQMQCEDAISRQAVLDLINADWKYEGLEVPVNSLPSVNPQEPKYCDRNICISNEYNGIGCDECEVIKSQNPKTGHWDKKDLGHVEYSAVCSECGEWTYWSERSNFCPNCGAKMVKQKESEGAE